MNIFHLNYIQNFKVSFMKMYLKMYSAKLHQIRLHLKVLKEAPSVSSWVTLCLAAYSLSTAEWSPRTKRLHDECYEFMFWFDKSHGKLFWVSHNMIVESHDNFFSIGILIKGN